MITRARFWIPLLVAGSLQFQVFAQAPVAPTPLEQLKRSAASGDPSAQFKLAQTLDSLAQNIEAEQWYRKAAQQGLVQAQAKVGNIIMGRALGLTRAKRAAEAEEGLQWLTLAANQGEATAQTGLANAYFLGQFVKQDLVEAYKWAALVADRPATPLFIDMNRIAASSVRDRATLKMSESQLAESRKRITAFVPQKPSNAQIPDPAWLKEIVLKGVSGPATNRLALINGKTFGAGELVRLKLSTRTVTVRCVTVKESSATVSVEGLDGTRELHLSKK